MSTEVSDPKLALPFPEPIGRVYRAPGDPHTALPEYLHTYVDNTAKPIPKRIAVQAVTDPTHPVVPSITNVIGVLNKPYLNTWYSRTAVEDIIATEKTHPGLLISKPDEAIKYFTHSATRDRDNAATQGSIVHQACENFAKGLTELPEGWEPDRHEPFLDAWKHWLDSFQPEFLHLEATVFGHTESGLRYAGTGDFIAKINGQITVGDYKTNRTGLHKEVALQLAAIAHAQHLITDPSSPLNLAEPMPPITRGMAVSLTNSDEYGGSWQAKDVPLTEDAWTTFQGLRQAWEFNVLDNSYRDGTPALGKSIPNASRW